MSRLVLLAMVVVLLVPGSALAQDFGPLAPADGAAVPVDPDGIPVTFTCPPYGLFGGPTSYGVTLSTSPALGPDGRLADAGALVSGRTDPAAPGQCAVALGAGGPPPRIQETPGSYYWQVWRICVECPTGYATAPVRALTLQSPVKPALSLPRKAYAGYGFFATVAVEGAPDGITVAVERNGTRVGTGTALGGKAEVVVSLPKGRQTLRASATIGSQTVTSETTTVTVAVARSWTTSRADGSYTGRAGSRSVRFKVAKKGKEMRAFSAFVAMTCPGVTAGQFTTQIGTATFKRVKIAPDGSFVAAANKRVELSVGPCVGNTAYTAAHHASQRASAAANASSSRS